MEFVTLDHANKEYPLRWFYRSGSVSIILLHEAAGVIPQFLRLGGSVDQTIFVISFSWYVGDDKALIFGKFLNSLNEEFPSKKLTLQNNIIFLMNSLSEWQRMREIAPNNRVILVNNAAFISEHLFDVKRADYGDFALMNAKSLSFKRHYLTSGVKPKVFISYNEIDDRTKPGFRDIRLYNPDEVYFDISSEKLVELNNSGLCGLALSEIEGACYASTEYLLTGLPTVSTPSLGGREEYYDQSNAVIVHPDPMSVAAGVQKIREKVQAGELNRAEIRTGTVARQLKFRESFANELASCSAMKADEFSKLLSENIRKSNKLWEFKNFWTKTIKTSQ